MTTRIVKSQFRARIAFAAALTLVAGALVGVAVAPRADAASAPNLVINGSLEKGTTWPDCFAQSGFGTAAKWTTVKGRDSKRAVSLTISGYKEGSSRLLQVESAACAPAVQPGATYTLSAYYKSTAVTSMTAYVHTAAGWAYWTELGTAKVSKDWKKASAVTPRIPAGVDRIVFGLTLSANGTLTTDDYSATLLDSPPPVSAIPGDLVVNGTLSQVKDDVPVCFTYTKTGNNKISKKVLKDDLPAGAPKGSRSYSITVSKWVTGDAKLLQSEAAGCAPTVAEGTLYDVSIAYKSSATSNSLTAFQHTAAGWAYWTEVKAVPSSKNWTTATATLPAIPAGVDRVSFGISIAGNGTLVTTGYTLVPSPPPPVEPPNEGLDPAAAGSWEVLDTELPIRALHTTLLNDGRLLLIAGSGNSEENFAAGTFTAVVWDPVKDTYKDIPVPYDMFCSGHVTLADGKVLLAGGTEEYPDPTEGPTAFAGSAKSYYFDPEDDSFHQLSDMADAHWYPTLTKLADGDIWSAGGIDGKKEGTVATEMFDSSSMSWLPLNQVPQTYSYWGTYPHMYLLDDGAMFYSGGHTFGNGLPGTGASIYDWTTAQIWDVPGLRFKDLRDQAASVLLPPAQDQRVMIVGGGNTETNVPATNTTDIIDLSVAAPEYTPGPDLPGPGKMYLNLVTLPDRTVLSANGATFNRAGDIKTAALYNTAENSWKSIASDPIPRNYHSTAILLPDGRVAIFGSNPGDNSFEKRVSIYSPPYLHKGTRPTITGSPERATYGDSFSLTVTGDVASASLMAPMSATHQTDTNARLVDIPLAGVDGTRVAQIPDNPNLLPPGPYMLTVLDTAGVPSIAKWVWIS